MGGNLNARALFFCGRTLAIYVTMAKGYYLAVPGSRPKVLVNLSSADSFGFVPPSELKKSEYDVAVKFVVKKGKLHSADSGHFFNVISNAGDLSIMFGGADLGLAWGTFAEPDTNGHVVARFHDQGPYVYLDVGPNGVISLEDVGSKKTGHALAGQTQFALIKSLSKLV